MFTIPILNSYLYEGAPNQCLNQITFTIDFLPSKTQMRIFSATSRDCSFDAIVLIAIPKSYLDASHMKPWLFIALNESFQCCILVSCILAQLTKI
jgi:hypothetical protein